ncbi:MAG: Eco57I restriction-modification methylase domain-containing protein, partial [Acidobacteria bacterium]|nr:Eco57I restriction-modification methylase domain-containing protein [Acidobacteriota bacterium]
ARERESFVRSRTAYELKRHGIQTSLYGVDIDPGAVEIAKLRLWLSLVVDEDERERVEALPNLDYKIMQGNALLDEFAGVKLIDDAMFEKPVSDIEAERAAISARINELTQQLYALHGKGAEASELKRKFGKEAERLVKQSKALTQPKAAENISLLPDDSYREARAILDEMRRRIDEFFSLTSPREKREARGAIEKLEWRFMEQTLKARGEEDALKELALHRRDNRKPYFLWKLYFSDVFQSKGGFDVVIGNPPYLNVERVDAETKRAYAANFNTLYKRFDVFGLFFEQALMKLVIRGTVAFIIPSQILNNLSYKKLRDLMLSNEWLREVLYLGDKIFEAANNDVCVLFLQKPKSEKIRLVNALDFATPIVNEVETNYFDRFERVISFSTDAGGDDIFDEIFNPKFQKLRESFDVFQGIVTGNNPVYLLSDEQIKAARIEKQLLHPLLLGRDFGKWLIKNADRQIIYLDSRTDIKKFPNTESWLLPHKKELMQRRECQRGVIEWYSLQWARNKEQLDYTPKIMVQRTRNPRLKTRVVAALDEKGFYGMESIIFIVPKIPSAPVRFLLAVLNSSLINYLYQTKFLNVSIKGELALAPRPQRRRAPEYPESL